MPGATAKAAMKVAASCAARCALPAQCAKARASALVVTAPRNTASNVVFIIHVGAATLVCFCEMGPPGRSEIAESGTLFAPSLAIDAS